MVIFASMNKCFFLSLLLLCLPLVCRGQRRLVVADIETSLPVARANVQTLKGTIVADSVGRFTVSDTVQTLVVSHVNYESRIVNTDQLQHDTVFVISKLLNLKEVVVFGKGKIDDDQLKQLQRQLRMQRTEAQLLQAQPSQGVNLLALFKWLVPRKWLTKGCEKRRQHHEKVLNEY